MSLKLSVATPAAAAPVCSTESLIESIDNVSASAEALYECMADGLEICQVMDNLALVSSALDNSGMTAEFLETFNSEGETLAAAGVEALTVDGLKAMKEDQVEKLEDRVSEGLEGVIAEYWNKFVAWLKNMWVKIVNWFKSILVNRARYISALGAVEKMTKFNDKAKVTIRGLCADTTIGNKATTLVNGILTGLDEVEKEKAEDLSDRAAAIAKQSKSSEDGSLAKLLDSETKEYTVGKLFSNLATFKTAVKTYIKYAKDPKFTGINKKIDSTFKKLIADAGKAGQEKDAAKATALKTDINNRRELLVACLGGMRLVNRECMMEGAELLAVYKAANTDAEKK